MQRIVINSCFGGFGLSEAAYEKLIEWGVPVRRHKEQREDLETGLFLPEPANDGEIIFDRDLTETPTKLDRSSRNLFRRYWGSWIGKDRTHPLLIRVVEELKGEANGEHAKLKIVTVPSGVEWTVEEYDGHEHVAEKHRTWR